MTREEFNQGFSLLFSSYLYSQEKMNPETQEAYWLILQDMPADKFQIAVKQCMVGCKFFPSINEIVTMAFPPYTKPGPYNPYGDGKLITVSSMEQLADYQKQAAIENNKAKQLVDGMLKKIE